jgi:outer membrane protein OmpA-like peptidoglycan-associated protein
MNNPDIRVELSSHTDSRGSADYNLELSETRAMNCAAYLGNKGVAAGRIVARGYGETRLLNACTDEVECSEEQHQQNRRTELRILQ